MPTTEALNMLIRIAEHRLHQAGFPYATVKQIVTDYRQVKLTTITDRGEEWHFPYLGATDAAQRYMEHNRERKQA